MAHFRYINEISGSLPDKVVLAKSLVESDITLSDEWITRLNRVVVPVESDDHFSRKTIANLAAALHGADCFAILTEEAEDFPAAFRFKANVEALTEINDVLSIFAFLLVSDDLERAVLCTKADYYLLAGDALFIETVLGEPINVAQSAFIRFAEGWANAQTADLLRCVVNRFIPLASRPR